LRSSVYLLIYQPRLKLVVWTNPLELTSTKSNFRLWEKYTI